MALAAQPPSSPRLPVGIPLFEVHPEADHTGTLYLDYGVCGVCGVCEIALPKKSATFLLALALARTVDQRKGARGKVGWRALEPLARIYGALPGALFGRIDPRSLYGYKRGLLTRIAKGVRALADREGLPLAPPELVLAAEKVLAGAKGQGYLLGTDLDVRGVDVEALLTLLDDPG